MKQMGEIVQSHIIRKCWLRLGVREKETVFHNLKAATHDEIKQIKLKLNFLSFQFQPSIHAEIKLKQNT